MLWQIVGEFIRVLAFHWITVCSHADKSAEFIPVTICESQFFQFSWANCWNFPHFPQFCGILLRLSAIHAIPFFSCEPQKWVKFEISRYFVLSSNRLSAQNLPSSARLLQLLSYVCNKTQTNIQIRDACYGCYFRAASLPSGVSQLLAVSQCSNIYLLNSTYTACAQDLAVRLHYSRFRQWFRSHLINVTLAHFIGVHRWTEAVVDHNPVILFAGLLWLCSVLAACELGRFGKTLTIFLLFCHLHCATMCRFNGLPSWILWQINTCFLANLINRDFNVVSNRIGFYTNTTACILARTRCSIVNPITGDIQRQNYSIQPDGITNSVGSAGYFNHNALQVSRNGDIKIVAFPTANVVSNALCSSDQSLDQSPYNLPTCY